VRFALNAFVGTTALWLLLRHLAGVSPIWTIASMIAASEPIMGDALRMFRARMINAAVGCAIGLIVLITGGSSEWKLPIAISIAVLVSSYFVRIPTMWRQAPITAPIIIASGLERHSKMSGVEQGLRRGGRGVARLCRRARCELAHVPCLAHARDTSHRGGEPLIARPEHGSARSRVLAAADRAPVGANVGACMRLGEFILTSTVAYGLVLAETEGFEPSIELYNPITV
jgi:Fusaric acid resistance protein-like